jgi:hypothetical protein
MSQDKVILGKKVFFSELGIPTIKVSILELKHQLFIAPFY